MREIEFRGRCCELANGEASEKVGQWVRGNFSSYYWAFKGMQIYKVDGYEVDPKTVGQYTGLLDSNGAKVFAGDIGCLGKEYPAVEIAYRDGSNIVMLNRKDDSYSPLHCCIKYLTVIGNIHDNPELLEASE